MNEVEVREKSHVRDAQSVSAYQVRHTDSATFVAELDVDALTASIEGSIVRLAITSGPATLEQVMGQWTPGGQRQVNTYRSKYVEASYIARGQLVKLSAFCGVTYEGDQARELQNEKSLACAETIQSTLRKVQKALAPLHELSVRGGGFYVDDGEAWMAHPDQEIAAPPEVRCATCARPIYYANDHWRDSETREFEMWLDQHTFDHVHDPEEVGRKA